MKLRPLQDRIIVKRVDQEKKRLRPASLFLTLQLKNRIRVKSLP